MREWTIGRAVRMAARLLACALIAFVVYGLMLAFLQDQMIYHPVRALDGTPSDLGLPWETVRIQTSDGETVAGWFVPAERPLATLLFLHGNAGNISHRLFHLPGFRDAGLSVLMLDYRGYGESTGRPTEPGISLDARAGWDHLTRTRGILPSRIALYGESLGSAPALALAQRLGEEGAAGPGAILLEGAFTSAREMSRRIFPLLPLGPLLRVRFDNLAAIRGIPTPTLLLHAELDEIVPLEMGRRLYEASPADLKELVEVPGASHNTLWEVHGSTLMVRVRDFLLRAMGPGEPAAATSSLAPTPG